MATSGLDTLDTDSLQALLGPELTAEQARMIYDQGPDAVVFALLTLAKRSAERPFNAATARDPSAPSGQTPPYVKPTRRGRAKPKGGRPGHPGHRRPTPTHVDRREEHALTACPRGQGPVRPCRGPRPRPFQDIPPDLPPGAPQPTLPPPRG